MFFNRRSILGGLGALSAASSFGLALEQPRSAPILTIRGKVGHTNSSGEAVFDLGMLSRLPQGITETETPWYPSKTRFEGPLAAELLKSVDCQGQNLKVSALNGYAVDIPTNDFRRWPVILATHVDGKPISVREKGPIFVIYPFDREPSLYNEIYFGRSIWQVQSIEIG
ncbi:hypothetical protein WBO78_27025 [Bosea sp. CCNWLW174]|uniref:hypothetical protein n=1 Tax=unclassified Bosea (in: a-proteobacteria) TaxID=2653178 RepID=UPI003015744A